MKNGIKLVTIKQEYFDLFDFNTEIMSKDSDDGNYRPFLMILRLKYKGKKRSFALPFRSNIQVNKNTKGTYFSLPKRYSTMKHHAHGLHYIKIFPIDSKYCGKYVVPDKKYDQMLIQFISNHIDQIVDGAQNYLIDYEKGRRENYCTDIDRMLLYLENE